MTDSEIQELGLCWLDCLRLPMEDRGLPTAREICEQKYRYTGERQTAGRQQTEEGHVAGFLSKAFSLAEAQ